MAFPLVMINIFLLVSLIAMVFIIGYAFPKKKSLIIRQIGFLTFLTFIYVLGYIIEINAASLEVKMFWNLIQYIAIPIIPVVWVVIAMNYIGHRISRKYIALLLIVPLITYIMRFTNDMHHLFYENTRLVDTTIGPLMAIEHALFYYFQVAYIIISFVVANTIYIFRFKKTSPLDRKRLIKVSLASFFPWVGLILNVVFASSFPLDYTAVLFPITIVLLIFSLREEHRLSISPFARNLMFMSSNEAVIVVNHMKEIIDFNDKANTIFGDLQDLLFHNIEYLKRLVKEFPQDIIPNDKKTMKLNDDTFQVSLKGIFDNSNIIIGYVYSFSDITENMKMIEQLKDNEEKIKHLIYSDLLTGLPNRNYLEQYIKDKKHLESQFVLMIDMNQLKYVNDHFGHQEGDKLIQSLANLLQSNLSENDVCIRLSGDEFLIFSHLPNEQKLNEWIQSLLDLALSIEYLSFAIGYEKMSQEDSFEIIYKHAEDAMYRHKQEMKSKKDYSL